MSPAQMSPEQICRRKCFRRKFAGANVPAQMSPETWSYVRVSSSDIWREVEVLKKAPFISPNGTSTFCCCAYCSTSVRRWMAEAGGAPTHGRGGRRANAWQRREARQRMAEAGGAPTHGRGGRRANAWQRREARQRMAEAGGAPTHGRGGRRANAWQRREARQRMAEAGGAPTHGRGGRRVSVWQRREARQRMAEAGGASARLRSCSGARLMQACCTPASLDAHRVHLGRPVNWGRLASLEPRGFPDAQAQKARLVSKGRKDHPN
uniref:Uncharacterized protein n=1 Tax=Globodera rostochiensis TaxID=31243 RepID=A0A914HTX1_GLORO